MTDTVAHGERARYGAGCRCAACKASNAAYQRGYRSNLRGDDLARFAARVTGSTLRRSAGRHRWNEPPLPFDS